ncbi:MAG: tetratricopeptide repeat protein [Planctomycetes bacterium]|nr:tetratricopeptide repeat protein [Planctomycetota bacterium]
MLQPGKCRLDPKFAAAFGNRGNAYLHKKEYDKAIKDFTEAIRDPKFATAFGNRGNAYLHKKEYDKAIKDFTEVIRLDPKNALTFLNRGYAYQQRKEYDKAIKDYTEAIRLDPNSAFAHNNLAWLLATCPNGTVRDGKKATEHATRACELSRWKDSSHLGTLAAGHAESGNFKEAVKWQKKAIGLGFEDKEDLKKARQRLKLYEGSKPYRDQ